MLPMGAIINPADNSGAKKLQLINMPGKKRKFAQVGDAVTAVVLGAASDGNVKDHSVVRVIVVRTRKEMRRKDGSYIRFDDNAAVVVDKTDAMIGTRVFGPVAREIRDKGLLKIASLAKEVL
jgi:large subunit ribosomal protein L14